MFIDWLMQAAAVFGFLVFPYQLIQLVARPDTIPDREQRIRKALLMVFFIILFAQWFAAETRPLYALALTVIMMVYLVAALSEPVRRKLFRLKE